MNEHAAMPTPNHQALAAARPLKVALLGDWFLPHRGGIEIQMYDLAQQLLQAGHTVHVLTPIPGPVTMDGIRVHRLPGSLVPQFGFVWTRTPFRAMAALFQQEGYDVVHCHTSYIAPTAYGGLYVSQKLGVPTVVTFHSLFAHFTKVLAACNYGLHWSTWPVLFSGVSGMVRAEIQHLVAPQPVYPLPNAIDPAFWKAMTPAPRPANELCLVTVTRFSPRKRLAALLKILRAVKAQLPQSINLKLVIVGDGALRAHLERLIVRWQLNATVDLVGYQSRSKIRELYARADLFVQASVLESFGVAALEARCAGVPVVARRSGVAEFIHHNQEGLLADSDEEMVNFLVQLCCDPALRLALARHNWATRPPFGWDVVLPQHLALYRAAMELLPNAHDRTSGSDK